MNCLRKFCQISLGLSFLILNSEASNVLDYGNHNKEFSEDYLPRADWSNPGELMRTWQHSLVRIPVSDQNYIRSYMREINFQKPVKLPTIIYLHGCAGVWKGTHTRLDYLAQAGFAVIAPQSFARKKYPRSCDVENNTGGLYRDILYIRQNDAKYAIKQAIKLPWVDKENLFLMGLSEGGITTATVELEDAVLSARIIEGWTCHAGWQEYTGLSASITEPVLSLVGKMDPWFQLDYQKGDCGTFMSTKNGSRSIVFTEYPLKYQHELMEDVDVQKIILDFLDSNLEKD